MSFQFNHIADSLKTNGNPGYEFYVLNASTTDATATLMKSTDATTIAVSTSDFIVYEGLISAVNSAGVWKSWKLDMNGTVNLAGVLSGLLGLTPTTQTSNAVTTASWTISVTQDNTNKRLNITVTGASGQNLKWGGFIRVLRTNLAS